MEDNNNITRRKVFSSLAWRVLERILTQGCSLLVQVILARLLLPSDFGNLAIILAIVGYLSVFVQSGVSTAIIQKKDLSSIDVNTLFTISISIATVIFFLLFIISPYISEYYNKPELTSPLRVTASLLFFYSINAIQVGVLSRKMDFKTIFLRNSFVVPLAGTVAIIMAYNGLGLWSLITHAILNIVLTVVFMSIGTNMKLRFQYSKESACALYSFSIKIMGASMISGFSDLFRTMSIGKKYSTSDLAFYDRGYNYSLLVLQVINNSIQSVLLPVFSRDQDDISHLKEVSRKSIRLTVFTLAPFLFGMIIIAKPLVLLLLTEKWLPCVPFFMMFLFFRLAGSIVGIDKQVFMALGKSSIIFYFELFLLIANITMLLITVPISIKAIAIGALIVEYTSSFILIYISKRVYSYSLRERFSDLIRPILNSTIMIGIMFPISFWGLSNVLLIIAQTLTGFGVYILLAYLTKDPSSLYISNLIKSIYNHL